MNNKIVEINNADIVYKKKTKEIEQYNELIKQKYIKLVYENIIFDEELGIFDKFNKQDIYDIILNTKEIILKEIKDHFIKENKKKHRI